MFIFYTVNPEPLSFPKAYILKVFRDKDNESQCIKTVCFPNPDGKPDKKPDDNPDSDDKPDKRPDDKPDPDDDPSDKRKEDKKDDKKEESKGLLCDFFPDILACDKMGKPEEGMFDAISIPQTTDDRTWSSDDFLPPNGVCPQPKSFNIWGKPVQISYEPLCVFMEKVRFAVLLGFIIMSAFIVFGSLRK